MTDLVYANRVHEAASGSGLSSLTLLGALSGKATFTSKIATGKVVPYVLLDGNGVDWEVGYGTLSSASELQRTTVMDSSATSGRVNSETPGTPTKISLTTNQHEVFIAPFDKTVISRDTAGGLADPSAFRAALFVETVADMTALAGLDVGESVIVKGSATLNDGAGGVFYWDASDAGAESPPESYEHDTEATGLFKRLHLDVQGLVASGLFEIDAALADTATTGGGAFKFFFRKKATAATAWARWLADYVSSTVGRVRLGIRYAQSSAEKFFIDIYSTGDNLDRVEINEPVTLPTRTNSNGLRARALSWLSGASRLAIARADAANSATAADYWELPLTKGGYFAAVVESISTLKAIDAAAYMVDGDKALCLGRTTLGDCEPFYAKWSAASSATGDDYGVFRPSTGTASSGNGRWLRTSSNPNSTFTNSDATPSIANGSFFTTATTAPATITDFDDAFEGQRFVIQRGASDAVIAHDDTKIDLGGANITLTATTPRAEFVHVNGIHRLIGFGTSVTAGQVRTSKYGTNDAAFTSAVSAAGAGGVVIVDNAVVFSSTYSGGSGMVLRFEGGTIAPPASTATFTWSGTIEAPLRQVFTGSNRAQVRLGRQLPAVEAPWFGQVSDGSTDDAGAINAAIGALPVSGGKVRIYGPISAIASPIVIGDGTSTTKSTRCGVFLEGVTGIGGTADLSEYTSPAEGVRLKWTGADSTTAVMLDVRGPINGIKASGLIFDGAGLAGNPIKLCHLFNCYFENVRATEYTTLAWLLTVHDATLPSGVAVGFCHNWFVNCGAFTPWDSGSFAQAASALRLEGGPTNNIAMSRNHFLGGDWHYGGDANTYGLAWYFADNNTHIAPHFNRVGGGSSGDDIRVVSNLSGYSPGNFPRENSVIQCMGVSQVGVYNDSGSVISPGSGGIGPNFIGPVTTGDGATIPTHEMLTAFDHSGVWTNLLCRDDRFFIRGSSDPTKRMRFEVDGNTTGTTRVVTMPNKDTIFDYGSWTPTLTNIANTAARTAYAGTYIRIGDVVQFSVPVGIDPTAALTLTQFRVSLPIASNFSSLIQAKGVGACLTVSNSRPAVMQADATNDVIQVDMYPDSDTDQIWHFVGQYTII